jgi:hypothetical protein
MFARGGRRLGFGAVATRYRCQACGNVTRFDVVSTRRTRAFNHYSIAGELTVEEEEVLDERIERVTCRWCNATGERIEVLAEGADAPPA